MRRWFLAVCLCLAPALAVGQGLADGVVEQLRAQGYSRFSVESTLLGRLRIVATGGTRWREIVINPQTGEIVRDYSRALESGDRVAPSIMQDPDDDDDDGDDRSGSGRDDDDDRSGRGDGDGDDRDDDDDRSGHGGDRDRDRDDDRSGSGRDGDDERDDD